MIVRRCAQDHDVVVHLNNKNGMIKKVALADGTYTSITYPNSKKYFLWVDGEIVKKSDSFKTVEEEYVKECSKKHSNVQGRIDFVKHKIINNKVVAR
tara:strand:+ start:675 stop:965 length:291 start_codon:yes stop_codon:yes gene_type:complete